tara:strand:+ start:211 stop:915 length:705 start_codon:yes stop_codon:yes gene_type:complete
MDQLVFFWVGENLSIPNYFVNSIILTSEKKFKIIQVTDVKTGKIKGVDICLRTELPKDIMTARLKAYSLVETFNSKTIFCDADSLMINTFDFSDFKKGYHIMKRIKNDIINHNHPEYYPEFKNKYFMDLMPFLFGAIIINQEKNFFKNVYNICLKLPSRFHRWYGDQISLHIYYLDNKSKFNFFEQNKYMHIVSKNDDLDVEYNFLTKNKIPFITFKGSISKKRIGEYFSLISN